MWVPACMCECMWGLLWMPCSKLRSATNMNSIVYNKYPIMIAPAGNTHWHSSAQLPLPSPPLNQSPPSACLCIRRTNWINYENHENWVNSFWFNNCLAFVGHRTAAAWFFFFYFCIAMSCIPSPIRASIARVTCPMPHAACRMQLQCVNKNKWVSRGDQLPFNVIILIHFTICYIQCSHASFRWTRPLNVALQLSHALESCYTCRSLLNLLFIFWFPYTL